MPVNYKKQGNKFVHRIVWEAHHGPIPPGFDVHHKDEDKHNNKISNLTLRQRGAHISEHRSRKRGQWQCDCGATLHCAFGLCKPCYDKRYNALNARKIAEKNRDYYAKNWDRYQALGRARYLKNREKLKAGVRARYWRMKNAALEKARET